MIGGAGLSIYDLFRSPMLTPSSTYPVLPDAPLELPRLLGYRRKDFARGLGVSLPTVERWIAAGEVRTVKIGGTVIIPAAEAARVLGYDGPSGDSA